MKRSERAIPMATIDQTVRRVLAECSVDGCRRCSDGIECVRRGRVIICECAFEGFQGVVAHMAEEASRGRMGLPRRMAVLESGRVQIAELPDEMPPGPISIAGPICVAAVGP